MRMFATLVDYHLKGYVSRGFQKITLSGSYPHFHKILRAKMSICIFHLQVLTPTYSYELMITNGNGVPSL